ncbi:MAG: response regulator transcription factor [Candidatus Promineifilaceae bacterium]|nr:response regulator transcription factor [Candidatus Promineifilaceae bacterium]
MTDLRLLIVGPDPLARAGLATLLADQPNCVVVGRIDSAALPNELEIYRPDVIVWDLGWEAEESLALLEELVTDRMEGAESRQAPGLVVLLPDEETAAVAQSAGAQGLLFRDSNADRLLAAITAVAQGLTVVEPAVMEVLRPSVSVDEPALLEELTPREMEVLQLLAEGLANRAIAQTLDISEHTVKFHVNAIMSKLSAQSRTAAVVRATRLGLILL